MKYNFYPFNEKGKAYELVLVKDNKAVIEMKITFMRSPYNGYVTFSTKDIPKDWWGNYNAGALQYLDIHGGITYCECYNNNKDSSKLREEMFSEILKIRSVKDISWSEKWEKTEKLRLDAYKILGSLDDGYVVFGFDCAHAGDDNDLKLRNPEYVMELTERMEQQLLSYGKIYGEWKKMDRKDQTKAIEEITGKIKINELGFGAMIDILAGGTSFNEEEK